MGDQEIAREALAAGPRSDAPSGMVEVLDETAVPGLRTASSLS